ncbi:MAG: glycosyltransferase family 2 protein [Candidatus Gottesmanbacteria bacterium]|nr:glycosyltransferase family 2 protein [Candidatus Gottesmanbacteria bacterium]
MRGKPFLSVIIPAYNASGTLGKLLESLAKSTFKNFEVIVGDDASNEQYLVGKGVTIVRLTHNKGPAAARNAAVKRARGNVLVFLDADVTVYSDTLAKIAGKFKEDHDLTAITGVWDKHQRTKSFFPQFKAIRDWSYWTNERDRDGYYYLFSTRIAAIRRDVFTRLGGFNEAFRQMEDVELTYRIAKRYAIIFAPDVRVHHEFEGFFPIAKKYFWRSFYWTKLYGARRKFDPVATTMSETATAISGVGFIGLCACGFLFAGFSTIFNYPFGLAQGGHFSIFNYFSIIIFQFSIIFLLIHSILLRRFLWFCYREKGIGFTVKAFGTGLVLYAVILTGSLYYQLKKTI